MLTDAIFLRTRWCDHDHDQHTNSVEPLLYCQQRWRRASDRIYGSPFEPLPSSKVVIRLHFIWR